MFSRIRRHANYTNIVVTLAFALAMSGGAYAASKYVVTSIGQIKPNVRSALKGSRGATGAQGAPGAQGATGAQGAAGAAGAAGVKGEAGPKGEKGETGSPGAPGETGFTKTLPSGYTETGSWSLAGSGPGLAGAVIASISFAIPLAEPLEGTACFEAKEPCHVHYINSSGEEIGGFKETTPKDCAGTTAEPAAAPGNACIYEQVAAGVEKPEIGIMSPGHSTLGSFPEEFDGTGTSGAIIGFHGEAGKANLGYGSWAVTAP